MADTSLIFSIIARDKTTAILNRIQARASSAGRVIATALGPAIAPVAAVSTASILSLGAAAAGAGAAFGVFGGVAKAAMGDVTDAATKVEDLSDKMALYGRQAQLASKHGQDANKFLDKQAKAALELEARLSLLPPATRQATMAYLGMKRGWTDFVETNKPATFGVMTQGYKLIGSVIKNLQPFFDIGAAAARRIIAALQGMVDNGGLQRFAAMAGPATQKFTQLLINLGTAVTRTFSKMNAGVGDGLLDWLVNATARWAAWATATNQDTGINRFINYVTTHGPAVTATLGNLAQAAMHIAQAVAPLAPISIAIASALAQLVAAIPSEWLTAIIGGFIAFNVAMRVWAAGSAIATAAQWAMNTALLASPVTWIVAGIALIVAGIVLLATKTKFFQTVWQYVWGFMKAVGAWFAGPFANFFVQLGSKIASQFNRMKQLATSAVNGIVGVFRWYWTTYSRIIGWVLTKGGQMVAFFRSIPGRIGGALRNVFQPLWNGFRTVANRIISGWNNLSFSVGGGSFMGVDIPRVSVNTPNIPYLDTGGFVRQTGLAVIHRGEEVRKRAVVTRTGPGTGSGGGGGGTLVIRGDGSRTANFLLELIQQAIRARGGDPVKVLTPR